MQFCFVLHNPDIVCREITADSVFEFELGPV